jgi:hypothetical protein
MYKKKIKSIRNSQNEPTKLFDQDNLNLRCYCCNYQADIEREYERHVILRHPGKLAYPSEIDMENKESLKI